MEEIGFGKLEFTHKNGFIQFWSTRSKKMLDVLQISVEEAAITALQLNKSGTIIAIGSENGTIHFIDLIGKNIIVNERIAYSSAITSMEFITEKTVLSGTAKGKLELVPMASEGRTVLKSTGSTWGNSNAFPAREIRVNKQSGVFMTYFRADRKPSMGFIQNEPLLLSQENLGIANELGYTRNRFTTTTGGGIKYNQVIEIAHYDSEAGTIKAILSSMDSVGGKISPDFSSITVSKRIDRVALGYGGNKNFTKIYIIDQFKHADSALDFITIPNKFGNFMSFSPNGEFLAIASLDQGVVEIYSFEKFTGLVDDKWTAKLSKTIKTKGKIRQIHMNKNGSLVTVMKDGRVQSWDLNLKSAKARRLAKIDSKMPRDVKMEILGDGKIKLATKKGIKIVDILACDRGLK